MKTARIPVTGAWRFAQFNDDVIAVNPNMAPQVATGNRDVFVPLMNTPNPLAKFPDLANMKQSSEAKSG